MVQFVVGQCDVPHLSFFIIESDAASSNDKLIAHRFNEVAATNPHCLVAARVCSCRQHSVIETSLCTFVGLGIVLSLYSISKVLQSRGCFAKMLRDLPAVVGRMVVFREGAPPVACRVYAQELVNYSVAQHKVLEHIEDDQGPLAQEAARAKWRAKWAALVSLANGRY